MRTLRRPSKSDAAENIRIIATTPSSRMRTSECDGTRRRATSLATLHGAVTSVLADAVGGQCHLEGTRSMEWTHGFDVDDSTQTRQSLETASAAGYVADDVSDAVLRQRCSARWFSCRCCTMLNAPFAGPVFESGFVFVKRRRVTFKAMNTCTPKMSPGMHSCSVMNTLSQA